MHLRVPSRAEQSHTCSVPQLPTSCAHPATPWRKTQKHRRAGCEGHRASSREHSPGLHPPHTYTQHPEREEEAKQESPQPHGQHVEVTIPHTCPQAEGPHRQLGHCTPYGCTPLLTVCVHRGLREAQNLDSPMAKGGITCMHPIHTHSPVPNLPTAFKTHVLREQNIKQHRA